MWMIWSMNDDSPLLSEHVKSETKERTNRDEVQH